MNILDQEILLTLFRNYSIFFMSFVLLGSFIFTWYLIPKVLWVSKEKRLTKAVCDRSSHKFETPSFGGVAFFMCLVMVVSVLQSLTEGYTGNHFIIGMTMLFLVGLKDDLVVSTAKVKLFGQIMAACFIIFSPEMELNTLRGFLGIYEIPLILSYTLKAFLVVGLINAYNLIDGIDGLASIIGIVIGLSYAVIFYMAGHSYYVLVSLCLVGMLSAFLRFNFSRGKRKIFMGDSGSLIIGFLIAYLSLKYLVMPPQKSLVDLGFLPENRVFLSLAVLFIPIFDTARVMALRLIKGDSPFSADRNHVHHVLLDLGFTHKTSSILMGFLNLAIIILYLMVARSFTSDWMLLVFAALFLGLGVMFNFLKQKSHVISGKRVVHSSQ